MVVACRQEDLSHGWNGIWLSIGNQTPENVSPCPIQGHQAVSPNFQILIRARGYGRRNSWHLQLGLLDPLVARDKFSVAWVNSFCSLGPAEASRCLRLPSMTSPTQEPSCNHNNRVPFLRFRCGPCRQWVLFIPSRWCFPLVPTFSLSRLPSTSPSPIGMLGIVMGVSGTNGSKHSVGPQSSLKYSDLGPSGRGEPRASWLACCHPPASFNLSFLCSKFLLDSERHTCL